MLLAGSAGSLPAQRELPAEEIFLRTGRDLYMAGEQVNFKLYTLDAASGKPVQTSDIVYLELLDRQHSPLVQKKIAIGGGEGSGMFTLPNELISDHYYLRAYTSWMKNAGAPRYAYQLLTVINPFGEIRPEMISPERTETDDAMIKPDHPDDLPGERGGMEIEVRSDRGTYGTRQKVVLEIETRDRTGDPVEASLLLSVGRNGLLNAGNRPSLIHPDQQTVSREVLYPPEWGGHFIRGHILRRSDGDPIEGDTLIYSVVGRKSIIDYSISDRDGNFQFLAKNLNTRL